MGMAIKYDQQCRKFCKSVCTASDSSRIKFFNGIVNKVKEIPGQMISIGSDIVGGIKRGISGAWGALTGWLGNMAKGLIDGVKGALGIGSPSRLFADRIGKWIPAGITLGVERAMPKAKAFMGRMSAIY